ncbi:hypothetical protein CEP51_010638 [Fusarium floridanum]|uniref:Uncharacterized protein n=1 Tax=Fusarium floridanum TaxID=1325733 RepID=A0A428RDT9_9HYPO|nr:hypothetical protein CEP51_010638 [Fusarium floridanum]
MKWIQMEHSGGDSANPSLNWNGPTTGTVEPLPELLGGRLGAEPPHPSPNPPARARIRTSPPSPARQPHSTSSYPIHIRRHRRRDAFSPSIDSACGWRRMAVTVYITLS